MLFLIDLASMDGISLPIYKKGGCKYENRKYMGFCILSCNPVLPLRYPAYLLAFPLLRAAVFGQKRKF